MNDQKPCHTNFVPQYESVQPWEFYLSYTPDEYLQSFDEGLDVEAYKNLFYEINRLPQGEIKKAFCDVLFDIVRNAAVRDDYAYTEPSDLEGIRALRKPFAWEGTVDERTLESKLHGAWVGRVCGCMLGKSVEGIRSAELARLLRATDNYPMHRYILQSDIDKIDPKDYEFPLVGRPYADAIDGMPADDDTNYTVMAQRLLDQHGRDFTPGHVMEAWIASQPKDAYCTAERVAFCNYIRGYRPPDTALYKNPYREWIGAQIRTDYYGYINPRDPETAAEMAWRDASISHVKNGIYGAMFVSAMLAAAAVTPDMMTVLEVGLAEIPHTSRLYESIRRVMDAYKTGVSQENCFAMIHETWDEYQGYCWCHTISNAMIVAASLLYGEGDYGRSICMAVQAAFDTDCNGATVGSIIGMAYGIEHIPACWQDPIHGLLHTAIFGMDSVRIADAARRTLDHIRKA